MFYDTFIELELIKTIFEMGRYKILSHESKKTIQQYKGCEIINLRCDEEI